VPDAEPGQVHRFVDGRVGVDAHREQLVRAEPQDVQNRRVEPLDRPVDAVGQDLVVAALRPQRSVGEFGGESGVATVEPSLREQRR
jgi:hypothetical protein